MNLFNPYRPYFNSYDAYENFYGSLTGSFWIGLRGLYALTNTTDMVLRYEFVTVSKKSIILEYSGFKILDDTNYRMFYKHFNVIEAEYNVEDHMKCMINQPFTICANIRSAWWGECEYNSPLSTDGIKWNINETITAMKMKLRKTVLCKTLTGKYIKADGVKVTISVTNNKLSGIVHDVRELTFTISLTQNDNEKCYGITSYPDRVTTYNFEYLENECIMQWDASTTWTKEQCTIERNSPSNCSKSSPDSTLCGNCIHVEKLETKVSNICDCRNVQATSSSCESAVSSQNVSGIYTITTTQTSFDVLCEIVEGKIWTTYMNLLSHTSSFFNSYDVYENFYGSLTGSFWIGLKGLYALTNATNMVLRLEFNTVSNKTVILEYSGFKLLDDTNYRMFYKYYNVIKAESIVDDYMKCMINQPFTMCTQSKSAWWGECTSNSPLSDTGIMWNLNESIIGMKMQLRKTELCGIMQGTYNYKSVNATVVITDNQLSGVFGNGRPPFSGYITKNNEEECLGVVTFPDESFTSAFEYDVNKCRIHWKENNAYWNKDSCIININPTANCKIMFFHYQCPPNKDYYIDPDGQGSAFKVRCSFDVIQGEGRVITNFFYRRISEGSTINEVFTQEQMYNGVYLGTYKYFWIGFKNLYRLIQSNVISMFVNDPEGHEEFRLFRITNESDFAMTYHSHARFNAVPGNTSDPLKALKGRGLEACGDYMLWWDCDMIGSSPFQKKITNLWGKEVDFLEAHIIQPV